MALPGSGHAQDCDGEEGRLQRPSSLLRQGLILTEPLIPAQSEAILPLWAIWQGLEMYLVIMIGCSWHPVGEGQGLC